MKAISVRQPWAWLIVHAGKDIENRTWKTSYRGDVLIHASRKMERSDWREAVSLASKIDPSIDIPVGTGLKFGGIIGKVTMVDVVVKSDSPWFFGPYGFVFQNPIPLEFYECPGQLTLFDIKHEMREEVKARTRRQIMASTARRMVGRKVTFEMISGDRDSRRSGWVVSAKVGGTDPVTGLLGWDVVIKGKSGKEITIDSNINHMTIYWDSPRAW